MIAPAQAGEEKMIFYVTTEELYDRLKEAHGSYGKHRMIAALKKSYKNVTQEAILMFLQLCPGCLEKKRPKKRGLTVKPMVFKLKNDRAQVDLVDMQSSANGPYKWIMVVPNHNEVHPHPSAKEQGSIQRSREAAGHFPRFRSPLHPSIR